VSEGGEVKVKDIIMNFITPAIGLFGVWLGSYLTRKNNLMLEKTFYGKKN
jgi:hypothetical protein